jgi:cytochrome c2
MMKKTLLIPAALLLLAACQSNPEHVHENAVTPVSMVVDGYPDRAGDPASGEALFNTLQPDASVTCSACHNTDSEERLIGPGLLNVGTRAQTRLANRPADQYLHDSIINPSAYVVDGYPDIMPKNWGTVFTEDELTDLIAYLKTLH